MKPTLPYEGLVTTLPNRQLRTYSGIGPPSIPFAGTAIGDIYFDTLTKTMFIWTGDKWHRT